MAGLAAVLGGGAYLVTDQLTKKQEPAAIQATQASSSVPTPDAASTTPATKKPDRLGPVATAAATSKSVDERVDAARSANKRLGTEVRRPLPRPTVTVDETKLKVVETGSPKERHTFKVASAPQDLTGYRELAWVRNGKPVGGATCTKSITTSPDVPPKEKPTLLICWKTSAKKSAYTVAVDFDRPPSEAVSVAALEKAWAAQH